MGIDLTLMPMNAHASFTLLPLDRDYDLHDKIQALDSQPIPNGFVAYNGAGFTALPKDAYGDPIRYVLAGALRELAINSIHVRNRAAWAYLKELPDDHQIALYWH